MSTETARIGEHIQTFTGRKFWPLDPRAEDIDIEDIAHALSNLCRFSGHSRYYYSVAEHSVRVMALCRDNAEQRWGLMHDAAEAYIIDMPRPLKYGPGMHAYRDAEVCVMAAIAERFGLCAVMPAAVKMIDNILLATEVRDLMTPDRDTWSKSIGGIEPLAARIDYPWSPDQARRAFLAEARRLGLR